MVNDNETADTARAGDDASPTPKAKKGAKKADPSRTKAKGRSKAKLQSKTTPKKSATPATATRPAVSKRGFVRKHAHLEPKAIEALAKKEGLQISAKHASTELSIFKKESGSSPTVATKPKKALRRRSVRTNAQSLVAAAPSKPLVSTSLAVVPRAKSLPLGSGTSAMPDLPLGAVEAQFRGAVALLGFHRASELLGEERVRIQSLLVP